MVRQEPSATFASGIGVPLTVRGEPPHTSIYQREIAMELTATQMALVFSGCVLAIGGLFVGWRRGVFSPKPANPTADASTAHTGEAAK
jgi:hypothetical protein